MSRQARIFYWAMIVLFVLLAVVALSAGWWIYSAFSVLLGLGFIMSAPYVIEKRWRTPERKPRPRRVVRRWR